MNSEPPALCSGDTDFENHRSVAQKDALSWFH